MKKTQMQLAQEAIARLNAMSREELLSVLIEAGVAEPDSDSGISGSSSHCQYSTLQGEESE
ncbi:hypothetical protein [Xenorhabdus griffiniae]|uniref:hypothetical protein n=1 Tax=Xenorhabdus griffiniae TaxID=351672 RepID=UPI00235A0A8D|nr:hypothetical protein [Xenorhabdus griffiniae]MDC9607384.1 hypothetical protein [Xenorhabdus griffiniae]